MPAPLCYSLLRPADANSAFAEPEDEARMSQHFRYAATTILAVLLCLGAAHGAPKGGVVTLTPEAVQAPAGAQVRVPIRIDLQGFAPDTLLLRFDVDASRASVADVRVGPAAAGRALDFEPGPGTVTVVLFGGGGLSFEDGGVLCDLVLALDAGAENTSAAISDGGSEGATLAADPVGVVVAPGSVDIGPNQGGHSADTDGSWRISLSELLRVIQFYNTGALACGVDTEDGYAPGTGNQACTPHDSDYNPQDWNINLSELLRLIQLYNADTSYSLDGGGEDGYAVGPF